MTSPSRTLTVPSPRSPFSRSSLACRTSASHITPLQRISAAAITQRLRSGPAMTLLRANPTTATGIDPTITAQASA